MDLLSYIPNNLSDVLLKIIRFTELRRDVLYQNVHNVMTTDFRPQDMPVIEFAAVLHAAVVEHIQKHRLIFCDTDNIRFGSNGSMEVRAVHDERAEGLLQEDRDAYIEYQMNRLLENALNRKLAKELLRLAGGIDVDATGLHVNSKPAASEANEKPWGHGNDLD